MNELDIVPAESLDSDPSLDAEGAQLRALAEKADMTGETTPEQETETPEAAKPEDSTKEGQQRAADPEQKKEAVKSDSPEASAERDEHGRFKAKSESAYDKAKKEQDRQKSVLANFEEEKKRERAAIAQERQELRQQMQQLQQMAQQRQQPQAQGPRFSSQHLVAAVDEFEATAIKALNEGDTETAQKNIDLARKARVAAQESYFAEQQEQYQGQYQQHAQAWRNTAAEVIRQHPELADETTEQAKKMQQLLQAEPVFGEIPDGFAKAYGYLQMHMAAEASGLKDEKIASLEKQLKDLQERTGLSGSGPSPRSERNTDDLPLDEQGEALRRQLDADRLAYA